MTNGPEHEPNRAPEERHTGRHRRGTPRRRTGGRSRVFAPTPGRVVGRSRGQTTTSKTTCF